MVAKSIRWAEALGGASGGRKVSISDFWCMYNSVMVIEW